MKNKKIKYSILFLFLLICGLTFGMLYPSSEEIQDLGNIKNPKLSAGEITILTPGNQTYIGPMSGYYPGSYGFENDQVGVIPEGWTDESQHSSNFISVYDQKDQHYQVVRIYDANTATGGGADTTAQYNFQSPQVSGSIECWVYKESGSAALVIQGTDGSTSGFQISIDSVNDGTFRFAHAPSSYTEFASGVYADQEWFHLRIDFNCDTDTADYYLNGIKEVEDGSFHLPVSQISYLLIRSGNSGHAGVMYFDAVSFSWDGDYIIGDSLNEGLLLSYDNTTILNWQGYSLDGQPNKTILGDTTIPMPANGYHKVQVFGHNSIGAIYESDVKHFTISDQEPPLPPLPPDNPYIIPIIITSIVIGIVVLIGTTLIVFRNRLFSPKEPNRSTHKISKKDETKGLGTDQLTLCPFCGIKIQKVSKFCVNCGSSLIDE